MTDDQHNRRRFLKTAGAAGSVALAGCIGQSGDDGSTDNGGGAETTTSGAATTGSARTPTKSEIVWLHDRSQAKKTIEKMTSEFSEQHDSITVTPQLTPSGTGTEEELQKMQAAGEPPEILWFTFGQAYRFAKEGKLASITGVVEDNDLRTFGNRQEQFFATSIVGPITWHYRKDLYDEPETYADYLQQAQRIEENNDIDALQIPNGETTLAIAQATQFLWNGGVDIFSGPSDDIKYAMGSGENRKRAVDTYEWIKNAYEYASNGNGLSWGAAASAYQKGSAASVPFISQWIPAVYLAEKPDIRKNTANGFHPAAKGASDDRIFAWFEGNMLWDTDNNGPARKFLRWFHKEEQQRRFISSNPGGYIPATAKGMNADWYRKHDAIDQDLMDKFANRAGDLTPPVASGTDGALAYPAVANGLVVGQAEAQLLHGGKSPEKTIDWLGNQLDMSIPNS